MREFLVDYYSFFKFLHIVSIICWMAGLFYLPRLFVYHQEQGVQSAAGSTFAIMEKRLFYIIMQPAMFFSLATGLILAIILDEWSSGWMHLKLFSVICMVFFHVLLNKWRIMIVSGTCQKTARFFRIINEVPTILLLIIVACVVFKPF